MRVTKTTSIITVVAATLSVQSAYAQTQTIATPLNANAINLLSPFSTLLGTTAITQNFSTAVSINNNTSAAQRAQALIDNTITTDNGVVLSDGLGANLNAIWKANNSQAANGTTTTFSTNLQTLFRQINAISQDDSGKAKNYFADGSANGSVFMSNANLALGKTAASNTPIVGIPLPAGGVFDVYDKAYAPITNENLTGNSRPVQVARQASRRSAASTILVPPHRTLPLSAASPAIPVPACSPTPRFRAATPPSASPRRC